MGLVHVFKCLARQRVYGTFTRRACLRFVTSALHRVKCLHGLHAAMIDQIASDKTSRPSPRRYSELLFWPSITNVKPSGAHTEPHPTPFSSSCFLRRQLPLTMAGGHMKYRALSRSSAHRQALLRNLVTSLFKHESIATTWHKAKEAQRLAEKLVTLGKKNTEASRRRAHQIFYVR